MSQSAHEDSDKSCKYFTQCLQRCCCAILGQADQACSLYSVFKITWELSRARGSRSNHQPLVLFNMPAPEMTPRLWAKPGVPRHSSASIMLPCKSTLSQALLLPVPLMAWNLSSHHIPSCPPGTRGLGGQELPSFSPSDSHLLKSH